MHKWVVSKFRTLTLRAYFVATLMLCAINAAGACDANQITLPDNSCVDVKFTITVEPKTKNTAISFNISAMGTFYVDWGDNQSDSIQTIPRNNTTVTPYSHTYSSTGPFEIRIGGLATGYDDGQTTAAISFMTSNVNKNFFTEISGDLSAIFPVLGTTDDLRPRFYRTFYNCNKIKSIPENLFRGITSAYNYTFYQTFYRCSALSGFIPPSAFGGLIQNGHPYGTQMMASMFANTALDTSCSGDNHRQYITGYESYWNSKVSCGTRYAITYVLDGGTNYAGAPTTFWDDAQTIIDGTPTKTNYVFAGWCTDSALNNCAMSQTIPIYTITPQTFYAKWTPVSGTLCSGGYYRNNDVCVAVGAGYWSENNSDIRTQCPTGLTTIGYGLGADSPNDCGYELHIGTHTIYLRQNRQTAHTLNVQIGNTIYYANMSPADIKMSDNIDNYLKVNVDGIVYSIYDDSGEEYTNQ